MAIAFPDTHAQLQPEVVPFAIGAINVGLIRSRGHVPREGYDVHDGSHRQTTPGAATVQ